MARKKKNGLRHIVVVSDIHAGSSVALCPPEVELDDGGIYRFSNNQKWLWERWHEWWEAIVPEWTSGEPYAIVINGDILEGLHHKSTTNVSSNLADQARVAYKILEPIRAKTDKFYLVRGTEAHAGKTGQEEERLAERLGAVSKGGMYSRWDLWCELGKHLIHFAHHIGTTSSAAYETSALNRELVSAFVEAGQWNQRRPDLIVRSHRHRMTEIGIPTDNELARAIVTPAWQLQTPFVYRIASMRLPQIGGIIVTASVHGQLRIKSKVWAPDVPAPEKL